MRSRVHKSGECVLPMRERHPHRAQPALGKDRIGGTFRETPRLSGRDRSNRRGESHKADNGLREFMPGTIASICRVTDALQITRDEIF